MVRFLVTGVETRLVAVREDVHYLWQIYFLHQFIPLVHHHLFLRMCNSDYYIGQNVYCVGLMDRGPVHPSFRVLIALSYCHTELSSGCEMSQELFTSYENMKFEKCVKILTFPKWQKNIYSSMTAIKRPLTGRDRTVRGVSVG